MENMRRLNERSQMLYHRDVENLPEYNPEIQVSLIKKYKETNDLEARNKILEMNQRLIIALVKTYRKNPNIEFLDYVQEGNVAFMKSLETYDPEKGISLSTYVTNQILWKFKEMNLSGKHIKPYHYTLNVSKLNNEIAKFESLHGRKPTDEEILENLKISKIILKKLQKSQLYELKSYNSYIENEWAEIIETLASPQTGFEEMIQKENVEQDYFLQIVLKEVLKIQEFFMLYYLKLSYKPFKETELGKILRLSRQRISITYLEALKSAKNFVLNENYSNFRHALDLLIERYGNKVTDLNPYPINIHDMLRYFYFESDLNDLEKIIFYEIEIERNNFDNKDYAKMFHIREEELLNIRNTIARKTAITDQNKFQEWEVQYLIDNKKRTFRKIEKRKQSQKIFLSLLNTYQNASIQEIISALKIVLETEILPDKTYLNLQQSQELKKILEETSNIKSFQSKHKKLELNNR